MSSFEIRYNIDIVLIRIIWILVHYKAQPSEEDLILFNLDRLKTSMKTNFKIHHRLSQLFNTLKQLDSAWNAMGAVNPREIDKKRAFIRRHGDYLKYNEPCEKVIRESKKVFECVVVELIKRYPDVTVPMAINSN